MDTSSKDVGNSTLVELGDSIDPLHMGNRSRCDCRTTNLTS